MRRVSVLGTRVRVRILIVVPAAAVLAASAVVWLVPSAQLAQAELLGPPTDLLALGLGTGQTPPTVPVQHNPEPPLEATPRAVCGPGSHPLDGMQGRVPSSAIHSPADSNGYWCNLTLVSHQGSSGGFKVFRYIDRQGHECAFYDTALLFPINAVRLTGSSLGVAVLDMSDPAHPVQTDTLTSLPMMSPHESLSLNARRGLLAAVLGNPATYPGLVSIYDVSQDCRHPVLDSTALVARFGHEGAFSPDGNTFYAAGTAVQSVTAIDVSDPKNPHPIWQGNEYSHGLTLSDDGNRAYVADPINGQLLILDTSQIQARVPNPQVREISRLTWGPVTIPQNAIPITIHSTPYLLEFDEYATRFDAPTPPDTVGAARLIDISDEQHPRVVSNLRLEVNQPDGHHEASGDPGALSPVQGYAAHYCNVPRENDPGIVACSFISSGLRVFDIHDPLHPREIAYYIAPPHSAPENGEDGSNFAMSKPAFAPERHEIWYSDGTSGFYDLRLPASLWPDATPAVAGPPTTPSQPKPRSCPAMVRGLTRAQRRRLDGHAGFAVTASRRAAVDGTHVGGRLTRIRHRSQWHRLFTSGGRTWYALPGCGVTGLLEVRRGVVIKVGVARPAVVATTARARRALRRAP